MAAQVLAIAHHAGGVGKTTTALSLAYALTDPNIAVLVVDLDPQGDLTRRLGIRPLAPSLASVLLSKRGTPGVMTVAWPNVGAFDVIGSVPQEMADIDLQLGGAQMRELRVRRWVDALREEYAYILLDCPPALSLLTTNALYAADAVLIPVQAHDKAVRQLDVLFETIHEVQGYRAGPPSVLGLLVTMTDHTLQAREAEADLRAKHGDLVFAATIPARTAIRDDGRYHAPIGVYAPASDGAAAYAALAQEVTHRAQHAASALS